MEAGRNEPQIRCLAKAASPFLPFPARQADEEETRFRMRPPVSTAETLGMPPVTNSGGCPWKGLIRDGRGETRVLYDVLPNGMGWGPRPPSYVQGGCYRRLSTSVSVPMAAIGCLLVAQRNMRGGFRARRLEDGRGPATASTKPRRCHCNSTSCGAFFPDADGTQGALYHHTALCSCMASRQGPRQEPPSTRRGASPNSNRKQRIVWPVYQ